MSKRSGFYPRIQVSSGRSAAVSQAGGVLLIEALRVSGLDRELSAALSPWRKPLALHDPAKVLCDLAVALALGGDCLADVALLRSEPGVYGLVASDATVSRTVAALAGNADRALAAISRARAAARERVWQLAGKRAPTAAVDARSPLIVDVDATLVTAHSDKEGAAPTFKRGYGHHPLWTFADHGADGTGEPLAFLLRPGNAGSNTASDHIAVLGEALRQLPAALRRGRQVLVRADGAGATHELLDWLTRPGRALTYSIGFTLPASASGALATIPAEVWEPAVDSDGQLRDGAWVAELTGLLDRTAWPKRMRVIVRKERPHPGAQLRLTDVDGNRITAFATNTPPGAGYGQLADLELRHRRRARCEDRLRCAKDTGLTNLPLFTLHQNRPWCALVALACELTAWTQLLAFAEHEARRWEPKRLRLRLFSAAGRLVRTGRQVLLRLSDHGPWTRLLTDAVTTLPGLPTPG